MKKIILYILAFVFLFPGIVLSQEAGHDEIVEINDDTIPRISDLLRRTTRRLRDLEDGLNINTETSGILTIDRGGTGQDFSAATVDTILVFTDTGVLGLLPPPGDSTKVLFGDLDWRAQKKVGDSGALVQLSASTPAFNETGGYDIGGDFASNTFTAPTDGKYLSCISLEFNAGTSSGSQYSGTITINNSADGYDPVYIATTTGDAGAAKVISIGGCTVFNLSSSDTLTVSLALAGSGTSWTVNDIDRSYWSIIQID